MANEEYQLDTGLDKEETTSPESTEEETPQTEQEMDKDEENQEVATEEIVEEEPDELESALKKMILNQSEIPEGYDKEKIVAVLKEHQKSVKDKLEADKTIKAESEREIEIKKNVALLSGGQHPEKQIGAFDSPEVIAEKKLHNKNVADFRKASSDYEDKRLRDLRSNSPANKSGVEGKNLDELSLKQRTKLFQEAGLVSKERPRWK